MSIHKWTEVDEWCRAATRDNCSELLISFDTFICSTDIARRSSAIAFGKLLVYTVSASTSCILTSCLFSFQVYVCDSSILCKYIFVCVVAVCWSLRSCHSCPDSSVRKNKKLERFVYFFDVCVTNLLCDLLSLKLQIFFDNINFYASQLTRTCSRLSKQKKIVSRSEGLSEFVSVLLSQERRSTNCLT